MTVIAMTREIGSHGTQVAAGVAGELNLKIVNSEIVASHVATNLGVTEEVVQRYLEGSASILERWQIDKNRASRPMRSLGLLSKATYSFAAGVWRLCFRTCPRCSAFVFVHP
jgi:hypothetical protein